MRHRGLSVLSGLLLLAWLVTGLPAATAAPLTPSADFYTPPDPLPPGSPGDVIRAEPMRLALSVGEFPAHARRIMYRSIDAHDAPMAVTGTVLDPVTPWPGPGPRPLVTWAVGGHGLGDQCAPSKLLAEFVHYRPPTDATTEFEIPFIAEFLALGIAVVVTDYQGLGTPGMHTFANRAAQAHAQMDAARAAQRLPNTSIPAHGPVGLFGYSQGGISAGASAESVASYAPELDVRGSFAGAPTVDIYRTLKYAEGTLLGPVVAGYYLNGLLADYPEARPVIDAALNAVGKHMLATYSHQCLPESALAFPFQPTSNFTVSGQPIPDILRENPVTRSIMASHNLGQAVPSSPVLLLTGSNDDAAPAEPVRELAASWCSKGASVTLVDLPIPTIARGTGAGHIIDALPAAVLEVAWMRDRLAGVPVPPGCSRR